MWGGIWFLRICSGMRSYGDVSLTMADVKLLDPGGWINDMVILFFSEYLWMEVAVEDQRVGFMSPNVAFLLGQSSGEVFYFGLCVRVCFVSFFVSESVRKA